jgi:SAM-dependent methyltransferase
MSTVHAFCAPDLALRTVSGEFTYRRCVSCGSVFAAPQPNDASLAQAYSNSYGNYQTTTSLIERLAAPLTVPEVRRFLRRANSSGNLIELGAGNGRFLERLRRYGWTGPLQGMEFDEGVAAATTARTGIQVRAGNIEHEVLPEAVYDAIVMRHVIEHLRDPSATLAMVLRALRPGGVLLIGTPDARALCARVFGRYWWGYEVPRHLVIFSSTALGSLLRRVGFTIADRWSGFAPQMWSASLDLLLTAKPVNRWLQRFATSNANPITMAPFSLVAGCEVVAKRSTMVSIVAQRPC